LRRHCCRIIQPGRRHLHRVVSFEKCGAEFLGCHPRSLYVHVAPD
jgi:hypothetical protein